MTDLGVNVEYTAEIRNVIVGGSGRELTHNGKTSRNDADAGFDRTPYKNA